MTVETLLWMATAYLAVTALVRMMLRREKHLVGLLAEYAARQKSLRPPPKESAREA